LAKYNDTSFKQHFKENLKKDQNLATWCICTK